MRKTHALLAMAGMAMVASEMPIHDMPDMRIKYEGSGRHHGFRNKQGQRPTKKKTGRYFARKAKHKRRIQLKRSR